MKTLLSTLFALTLFTSATFAQQSQSTPQKDEDVVKISTNLIQLDATVTDKKGNVITDLKPEDFEIYENGQKQTITNLSFVSAPDKNRAVESKHSIKSSDKFAAPVPIVKLKSEQVRRTYALVVDDLGLSFESTNQVKDALKKFVNEQMHEGDLVAILRVSGGLGALQSFTADKRQLMAAIGKIRWNGLGRVGINSFDPITTTLKDDLSNALRKDGSVKTVEGIEQDKDSKLKSDTERQSNVAIGTVGALNYVVRGMRDLPGRKSLMLFSEGFQILDYSSPIPRTSRELEFLRNLADLATRSSVVIYTIDPRGLMVPGAEAIDDIQGGTGEGRSNILLPRENKARDTVDSLKYLADETGGIAYVNQNNINYGLQKALDDQSGYYLIAYQPDSETFDPKKNKFNKIAVKVKRPDLKIRYRSGFFGVTDEKSRQTNQTPHQKLTAALNSPFGANEINLNLYSVFDNEERNRNFIYSFVYIDAKDIKFNQEANGKHVANLEILATTFGENGVPVDAIAKSYAIELDQEKYRKALEQGFVYNFVLPVKKPGAYQFRIGLRDVGSDKIGSASQFIEVPDVSKKNLTLSNLIVKNYPLEQWKKISHGQNSDSLNTSALLDTTFRQFKTGTILTYSYAVYNAKTDSAQKPQLQVQTRLFRDGKMILEGKPMPLNVGAQNSARRFDITDAVTLGTDLSAGSYVLQLIVLDTLAKEKRQVASQSIDFEIIK